MFRKTTLVLACSLAVTTAIGCKDEPKQPANNPTKAKTDGKTGDSHPDAVAIGQVTQNGLTLKATQDEKIKAGGEGAFDVAISGYAEGQKPKSVRFWVGVESAEGSVKDLAKEESTGVWHTHVEIPNPIPAGAKFWTEVEPASGEKFKASFELAK